MTPRASSLEEQARELSPSEHARLASKLIESLDPGDDDDAQESRCHC